MVCSMRALLSYIFKHAYLPCESWASLFLECSWPRYMRALIFGMLTRAAVFQSPSGFLWDFKKSSETKLVEEMFMDSDLSLIPLIRVISPQIRRQ